MGTARDIRCNVMLGTLGGALLVAMASFFGCAKTETEETKSKVIIATEMSQTQEQQKAKAIEAKDALFEKLSGRLTEVMMSKGPVEAITVCSKEAEQIAATVSEEQGVSIGRTSMKLRNQKNTPPEWAQEFVDAQVAEPTFVQLEEEKLGVLLPIKLQEKCLMCHGPEEQLMVDVKDKLRERYPRDKATGFQEGDLRGWFWVEVPKLEESEAS